MRVGVYVGTAGPAAGGAFTFTETVLRGLERHPLKQDFVVIYGGRHRPPQTTLPVVTFRTGLTAYAVFIRDSFHRAIGSTKGSYINSAIRRHGIDFLWMLMPDYQPRLEVPYAFTVWDIAHREVPYFPEVSFGTYGWEAREATYETMVPRATFVIVGNKTGANSISFHYRVSPERIVTIPLPAPEPLPPSTPLAPSRFPRPYLLYPAQFWPHKNHVNALLALKLVRESGVDVDLVLTGSDKGNLEFVRRTAASLGLSGAVHFLGFVDRPDLVQLYRNAAALLFVSLMGPDNLPPLEAFAWGCPVIASAIPGHVEQLGDAALLVDGLSPQAIAEGIKRLLGDERLRATLVERGKLIARDRSMENYLHAVDRMLAGFESIRRIWPPTSAVPQNPVARAR